MNSNNFKSKITKCKIAYIILAAIIIFIITKYVFAEVLPHFDKMIVMPIYITIVALILIILVYCLINNNRFTSEEKRIICEELDFKIDKIFEEYGLYITENYIVYLGSKIDFFRLFAIPIKKIDAIDTHHDSRHHYKKRGKEEKHKFLSFTFGALKDDLAFGDNNRYVFNIICGKKVYNLMSSSPMNKGKTKAIDEMADYICSKYKDIDYI